MHHTHRVIMQTCMYRFNCGSNFQQLCVGVVYSDVHTSILNQKVTRAYKYAPYTQGVVDASVLMQTCMYRVNCGKTRLWLCVLLECKLLQLIHNCYDMFTILNGKWAEQYHNTLFPQVNSQIYIYMVNCVIFITGNNISIPDLSDSSTATVTK